MVQPRALPGQKRGQISPMRPPVTRGSECEVSRRSDTLAVRNGVREDASAADSGRFRAGIVGFQAAAAAPISAAPRPAAPRAAGWHIFNENSRKAAL